MRRLVLLPLLLPLSPLTVRAAEPALLRATLAPAEAWVGQRAVIDLELLVRGTFAGVPAFDLPKVPGAVLIPPAVSPVLGGETVDGAAYTSQRHRIVVFAQRAGRLAIPPIAARFAGTEAPGTPPADYRLESPPLDLEARMPPGAENLGTIISSTALTVRETWRPGPGGAARVGDAFTRTVRLQAPDVPGMVFPPLRLPSVDGIAAYPGQPVVQDRSERGRTSGERTETVTYVVERPGAFTLPAVVLRWWNLDRQELVEERLPARRFDVGAPAPVAAPSPTVSEAAPAHLSMVPVPVAAALVVLAAVAAAYARLRSRRPDPEARAFAAFRSACRRGEPRAVYATLLTWAALDRERGGITRSTVEGGDPALMAEVDALEAVLFSAGTAIPVAWSPARLLGLARATRRRRRSWPRRATADVLAPLNP